MCDSQMDILKFIMDDDDVMDVLDNDDALDNDHVDSKPSPSSSSEYELMDEICKFPMKRKTHFNDPVPKYIIFAYDWERGATIIDNNARYWSVDWYLGRSGHPWDRCFGGFNLFPAHKLRVFVPDNTIKYLLLEMRLRRPELTSTSVVALVNEDDGNKGCEECGQERCHRFKALRIFERLNLNSPKMFIPHK